MTSEELMQELAEMRKIQFPVIITGPPHSGRLYSAKAYFNNENFIPLQISQETSSFQLFGEVSCTETPGKFEFKLGTLALALQQGINVLIEMQKGEPKSTFSCVVGLLKALNEGRSEVTDNDRVFPISERFRLCAICDEDDEFLQSPFIGYFKVVRTQNFSTDKITSILDRELPAGFAVKSAFLCDLAQQLQMDVKTAIALAERLSALQLSSYFKQSNELKVLDTGSKVVFAQEVFSVFIARFERGEQEESLEHLSTIFQLERAMLYEKIFDSDVYYRCDGDHYEVGRYSGTRLSEYPVSTSNVALTNYTKRLLQEIVGCVQNNENLLLVSSTGVGKTFTLELAAQVLGQSLKIINFSSQTEISDLLGGYKPVSQLQIAQLLYNNVISLGNALLDMEDAGNKQFISLLFSYLQKARFQELVKASGEFVRLVQKRQLRSLDDGQIGLIEQIHQYENELIQFQNTPFFFEFEPGILLQAIQNGDLILFDEINLAPEEVLDYLSLVLQNSQISVPEMGQIISKHKNFRAFASMNPFQREGAAGKKDLPVYLQKLFTTQRIYEMTAKKDITELITCYLRSCSQDLILDVSECYFKLKELAECELVTTLEQKPIYSIRTLCRALKFVELHGSVLTPKRAICEAFELYFSSNLNKEGKNIVASIIEQEFDFRLEKYEFRPRTPELKFLKQNPLVHVIGGIYFPAGGCPAKPSNYITTASNQPFLRDIMLGILSNEPILLEGVTSAGKSSMIYYLASLLNYNVIRINNHENTEISDYLGTFEPDKTTGELVFKKGPLIIAMETGSWLLLDELNLCNSEILESLNRLLDDNAEVFVPELNEVFHPEPGFEVFATENPSGIVQKQIYGGRKELSDAFKNRFLIFEIPDLQKEEMIEILQKQAKIDNKFIELLVETAFMLKIKFSVITDQNSSLNAQIFTFRDVLRVINRQPSSVQELAEEIFMIFGERERSREMRELVFQVINMSLNTSLSESMMVEYYDSYCNDVQQILLSDRRLKQKFGNIVFTSQFKRQFTLVYRSLLFKEAPLLVGVPGAGKTQIVELLACLFNEELIMMNLHKNSDVGDFLGQMRSFQDVENTSTMQDYYSQYSAGIGASQEKEINQKQQLFVWQDGALLQAMQSGRMLLLDEVNLASDSILERLNSVFELDREITVIEKPVDDGSIYTFSAHPEFKIVSTMNPGTDYGKKELSPALRNRMNEIWVDGIDNIDEIGRILFERKSNMQLVKWCEAVYSVMERIQEQYYLGQNFVFNLRDLISIFDYCCEVISAAPEFDERAFFSAFELCYLDGLQVKLCIDDRSYIDLLKEEIFKEFFGYPAMSAQEECAIELSQNRLIFKNIMEQSQFSIAVNESQLDAERAATAFAGYYFNSPTTRCNAFKLAKALRYGNLRPILIESSPGVGKTSLVERFAQVLNYQYTRINLSQNVDLSDIIGQNLPCENGFRFVEGTLLRALRGRNQFVLLDELNLANQAVLEGLNSVFDHRREIFVPELQRSVKLHESVVIFAAQNPAWQGSGRKQLPQSFLNRFLNLWFDELSPADYLYIINELFAGPVADGVYKAFIALVSAANREFGQCGGPWEVNLRDVFRIYDFLHGSTDPCEAKRALLQELLPRFREAADLKYINGVISEQFPAALEYPVIRRGAEGLRLGEFAVCPSCTTLVQNLPMIQAVLTAFRCRTPILLISEANEQQIDHLVTEIGELVDKRAISVSFSQETDVSDIFGCYEQFNSRSAINSLLSQQNIHISFSDDDNVYEQEVEKLLLAAGEYKITDEQAQEIRKLLSSEQTFIWEDGVITKAIEQGQLLHLSNVNYCTSAVLDRLNSLLERNSVFYLYEQGNEQLRELRIHPEFRIVLSYQLNCGVDVSGAIRNRCLEVFVDRIADFNLYAYGSQEVDCRYDNLRLCEFSEQRPDILLGRLSRLFEAYYPLDCDRGEVQRAISIVTAEPLTAGYTEPQLALLRCNDTSSHSVFFCGAACAQLEHYFRYLVSYGWQAPYSQHIVDLGAYQLRAGLPEADLHQQLLQAVLQASQTALQQYFAQFCGRVDANSLFLASASGSLAKGNYLYQHVADLQRKLPDEQFRRALLYYQQDNALDEGDNEIIRAFTAANDQLARLQAFREALRIDKLLIDAEQCAALRRYMDKIGFALAGGRCSYRDQGTLQFLAGQDQLIAYQPQNSHFGSIIKQILLNLAFYNKANKSLRALLRNPLPAVYSQATQLQFCYLSLQQNMERISEYYNIIAHNTQSIIAFLPKQLLELEQSVLRLAQANQLVVNPELEGISQTKQLLVILFELFQQQNFATLIDVSLINQQNIDYYTIVLQELEDLSHIFAEHELITQSRVYNEDSAARRHHSSLVEQVSAELAACQSKPRRYRINELFYAQLQEQLKLFDFTYLLSTNTSLSNEQFLAASSEFTEELDCFMCFVENQDMEDIVSYSDYLMPTFFILLTIRSEFEIFKVQLDTYEKKAKNDYDMALLNLYYNADSAYLSSRVLEQTTAESAGLLLAHIEAAKGRLTANEWFYLAASFEDQDFNAFRRLILQNSPFRSRMQTKEQTFEEGIENQLRDMFPGYEQQACKEVNSPNPVAIPPEIQLITDFGLFLIGQEISTEFDFHGQLAALLSRSSLLVQHQLVPMMESLKSYYHTSQQLFSQNSTVLLQLKSHQERRSIVCRNIYKYPYPAEVKQAIIAVKGVFQEEFARVKSELPEDVRLGEILEAFTAITVADLHEPLIRFIRLFEKLLQQLAAFNANTPIKFTVVPIKRQLVYFRRLELASWNSFFADIQQEEAQIALIEWPNLLVACETLRRGELEAFVSSYLENSSLWQFNVKLELLDKVTQIMLCRPDGVGACVAIQAVVGPRRLFGAFVSTYVEMESKAISAEFAKQIRLFQWDEARFDALDLQIRKSHVTILRIVRRYSELLQRDCRELESAYQQELLVSPAYCAQKGPMADTVQQLRTISTSRDARNFLETQLRAVLGQLDEHFGISQVQQRPVEQSGEQPGGRPGIIHQLNCNTVVLVQMGEVAYVSANNALVAALHAFNEAQCHRSLSPATQRQLAGAVSGLALVYILQEKEYIAGVSTRFVVTDFRTEPPGGRYLGEFLQRLAQILDSVFGIPLEISDLKQYKNVNSQVASAFGQLKAKYAPEVFSAAEELFERLIRSAEEEDEGNADSRPQVVFPCGYTQDGMQYADTRDIPAVIAALVHFLKTGFPEHQEEQESGKQQKLDGTGLGDAKGDESINSQVEEEELSNDQLIGNDDAQRQEEPESDGSDGGIEMEQEFGGQSQSAPENEQEEKEEEDMEKELGKSQLSAPSDEQQRDMDENSEELQDREEISAQNSRQSSQLAEQSSAQSVEYEQPEVQEEFREQDASLSASQEPESVEENQSFDDVLSELFQPDLEDFSANQAEDEQQTISEDLLDQSQMQEQSEEVSEQQPQSAEPSDQQPDQNAPEQDASDEQQSTHGYGAGGENDSSREESAAKAGENSPPGEQSDSPRADASDATRREKEKTAVNAEEVEQLDELDEKTILQQEQPNSVDDGAEAEKVAPQELDNLTLVQDAAAELQVAEKGEEAGAEPEASDSNSVQPEPAPAAIDTRYSSAIYQQAHSLSERLRQVLQPTQLSQLEGDYKTGKKLNLKKIIPFVASRYQKDKIWLRRTKPEKRDWQIVLCVDNSMSVALASKQQQIVDSVLIVQQAVKLAELGTTRVLFFGEIVGELKTLEGLTFTDKKSDFVGLFEYLAGMQKQKTLILVLTDGMISQRDGLRQRILDVQREAVVLFCLHDQAIVDKQQIVFEDAGGRRQIRKLAYLEQFPAQNYVVVRDNAIAESLGNAIAQYVQGML